MPRLSIADRQRVIRLHKDGLKASEIKGVLEEEGLKISKVALLALIKKYHNTGKVEDKLRTRAPKRLTDAHYSFIDDALEQDGELTTAKLHDLLLKSFPDIEVSAATVKRARTEFGWVTSTPKYCQLIQESNKQKRFEWCKKMIDEKEDFHDVIWTDESTVMVDPYSRKCYRKEGQPRKLKAKPKHPAKVHVWGGYRRIIIVSGILVSTK